MIAAGYSVDLYCDSEDCVVPFTKGQEQFYGQSWSDCAKEARQKGWKISRDRMKCLCPKCVAAGKSYRKDESA